MEVKKDRLDDHRPNAKYRSCFPLSGSKECSQSWPDDWLGGLDNQKVYLLTLWFLLSLNALYFIIAFVTSLIRLCRGEFPLLLTRDRRIPTTSSGERAPETSSPARDQTPMSSPPMAKT